MKMRGSKESWLKTNASYLRSCPDENRLVDFLKGLP